MARIDLKLNRTTATLEIRGFWPEDPLLGRNASFADAFSVGVTRFMSFVDAPNLDVETVEPLSLRRHLRAAARG